MISRYFTQKKPRQYPYIEDDKQAHLVYTMERVIIGPCISSHVDEDDLQDIANHACRKWKVGRVEVNVVTKEDCKEEFGKGEIFGWCADEIYLNSDWHGDNLPVLLHELAHWIASEKYGDDNIEAHGPEWAGIYIELLDKYKVMPRKYVEQLFTDYGVAYK